MIYQQLSLFGSYYKTQFSPEGPKDPEPVDDDSLWGWCEYCGANHGEPCYDNCPSAELLVESESVA